MTDSNIKRGVLLVNLGSPDSTSTADVRKYLNQFLMDERVLDSPWPIRRFVVSALILPKRPKESAEAYESIWWDEGSPLVVLTQRVQALLQDRLDMPVEIGMRYGSPSTEAGMKKLMDRAPDLDEIFLVPLYPHYAMSSFETAVVEAERAHKALGIKAGLKVMPPYYNDPLYIEAMAENARPHMAEPFDKLLFSFHGIPERHLEKSDPTGSHCLAQENCCEVASPAHDTCYRHQCFQTAHRIAERLGLTRDQYAISFQSRLGRTPWLQPYTDFELERFPKEGIKNLVVMSPAFVSDCLETLEELGIRGKEDYIAAGGESYRLIPCMNEHSKWIDALEAYCHAGGRTDSTKPAII